MGCVGAFGSIGVGWHTGQTSSSGKETQYLSNQGELTPDNI